MPEIEELKTWRAELVAHLAEHAFNEAKFYDSRTRTRHAAINAWQRYLLEYPDSPHANEVKQRIEQLTKSTQSER